MALHGPHQVAVNLIMTKPGLLSIISLNVSRLGTDVIIGSWIIDILYYTFTPFYTALNFVQPRRFRVNSIPAFKTKGRGRRVRGPSGPQTLLRKFPPKKDSLHPIEWRIFIIWTYKCTV
jgi:hypothetical protein